MSKSILNRIQRAIAHHKRVLALALPFWRDESNSKELRRESARIALRTRRILWQLEHYKKEFNRV